MQSVVLLSNPRPCPDCCVPALQSFFPFRFGRDCKSFRILSGRGTSEPARPQAYSRDHEARLRRRPIGDGGALPRHSSGPMKVCAYSRGSLASKHNRVQDQSHRRTRRHPENPSDLVRFRQPPLTVRPVLRRPEARNRAVRRHAFAVIEAAAAIALNQCEAFGLVDRLSCESDELLRLHFKVIASCRLRVDLEWK